MPSYNHLAIDLESLKENVAIIRTFSPRSRMMPMIKATGYGTCAKKLASTYLELGLDILGVAHLDEAIQLRREGVFASLFLLQMAPHTASEIFEYDLEVGVSTYGEIMELHRVGEALQKKAKVHLHIDTGMKRFGCTCEEALPLAKAIHSSPYLVLEGVMTHFIAAEEPSFDPFTQKQISSFQKCVESLHSHSLYPRFIHAQNSSGALRFSPSFCNMTRVGFAPFGYLPSLKPTLALTSTLIGINACHPLEGVGYSAKYVAQEGERVGIVGIGYHDGLHLQYSQKGYVMIRGQKAPYIGQICMDFMMVNLTHVKGAEVGDPVEIFGPTISLERFASFGNSTAREVMVTLGPRIERIFKDASRLSETIESVTENRAFA